MDRAKLPLNALRAFEAAARHLNLSKAAIELRVSQTAVSHQVNALESRLGVTLFRRLPRGLALTDEGAALVPVLARSLDQIGMVLDRFQGGHFQEVLNVGVVGTFALKWLMPRLVEFQALHPATDVRLFTNNNRVDIAGEGLDFAIRFGDGAWHGTEAALIFTAPLSLFASPRCVGKITIPKDIMSFQLLRSYRADEWKLWFEAIDTPRPNSRGAVFDSSLMLAEAVRLNQGLALLPHKLFQNDLDSELLLRPFDLEINAGSYWLTWLKSRSLSPVMQQFQAWLCGAAQETVKRLHLAGQPT
jgi:LysR family transcriptional regulator, regulator of gene expression of beta-lactamase